MEIIVISVVAGICGTGLGGLLTAFLGSRTDQMISIFLSFAGGVMTSIVFFELIPEAKELSNTAVTVTGLFIGVIVVLSLNYILDRISNSGHNKVELHEIHETYEDFYHEREIITSKTNLLRSGMLMFLAISLHTLPEGLALGAAGYHDVSLGFTLALIIGIHNIPEGMAIAAPLISGGLSKGKAVLLTLLAGVPTVIGAFIGVLFGGISDVAVALSFAIAGGAMLYVVYGEILPQTMVISKNRIPTISSLVGIIFGFILTTI